LPATRPKNGKGVGFFSLEMAKEQLASRVLAGESGIPADWVRRADLNQEHFMAFRRSMFAPPAGDASFRSLR